MVNPMSSLTARLLTIAAMVAIGLSAIPSHFGKPGIAASSSANRTTVMECMLQESFHGTAGFEATMNVRVDTLGRHRWQIESQQDTAFSRALIFSDEDRQVSIFEDTHRARVVDYPVGFVRLFNELYPWNDMPLERLSAQPTVYLSSWVSAASLSRLLDTGRVRAHSGEDLSIDGLRARKYSITGTAGLANMWITDDGVIVRKTVETGDGALSIYDCTKARVEAGIIDRPSPTSIPAGYATDWLLVSLSPSPTMYSSSAAFGSPSASFTSSRSVVIDRWSSDRPGSHERFWLDIYTGRTKEAQRIVRLIGPRSAHTFPIPVVEWGVRGKTNTALVSDMSDKYGNIWTEALTDTGAPGKSWHPGESGTHSRIFEVRIAAHDDVRTIFRFDRAVESAKRPLGATIDSIAADAEHLLPRAEMFDEIE